MSDDPPVARNPEPVESPPTAATIIELLVEAGLGRCARCRALVFEEDVELHMRSHNWHL